MVTKLFIDATSAKELFVGGGESELRRGPRTEITVFHVILYNPFIFFFPFHFLSLSALSPFCFFISSPLPFFTSSYFISLFFRLHFFFTSFILHVFFPSHSFLFCFLSFAYPFLLFLPVSFFFSLFVPSCVVPPVSFPFFRFVFFSFSLHSSSYLSLRFACSLSFPHSAVYRNLH
jgi:hypothetical protein